MQVRVFMNQVYRPFPRYCWLNMKIDCTYQSIAFNVILIDYTLIRYVLMGEGNKIITIESFVSIVSSESMFISWEHVYSISWEHVYLLRACLYSWEHVYTSESMFYLLRACLSPKSMFILLWACLSSPESMFIVSWEHVYQYLLRACLSPESMFTSTCISWEHVYTPAWKHVYTPESMFNSWEHQFIFWEHA